MNFNPNKRMSDKKVSKPKNAKYVFKNLSKYLWHFKWLLLLALVLTIGSNLLALTGPKLSGNAIDQIHGKGDVDYDKIFFYLGIMIVFYLVSGVLSYILSAVMIVISQSIVKKMRNDVFSRLLSLPISYFDTNQTGDILSKISYDIDTINTSLSSDLIMIVTSVVTIITSLVMMLTIAPIMATVFLVTIPISIIITKRSTKKTRKFYRLRNAKLGELNGFVEEKLTGHKTIQAYNQQANILADFDKFNASAVEATYNAEYYASSVGPTVNFMNNLSLAFIAIFGSILKFYGKISYGNISSFVLYSRKFSGPINEFANVFTEIQSAFAAAERVFILLDEKTEQENVLSPYIIKDPLGDVTVKDISFGYKPDKLIIKDVSFAAKKGQMIAIIGPTGAGKTTIINLLMRFYELNKGSIFIDDNDIASSSLESVRLSYAMVLQDTWLFTGSIYDNVLYGSKDKTKEDVIKVCKIARIHSFIESLPNGYDTILTEDGINISKGQKQLLTIARAMLLNSHMLILDEATSNVDTKTEQEIQASMLELMKNKTCFVIAHRLSTIKNADLILVVKDGNIIETGTHDELISKNSFYSELFYSQF